MSEIFRENIIINVFIASINDFLGPCFLESCFQDCDVILWQSEIPVEITNVL